MQRALPLNSWHWEFGPHGDGMHGFTSGRTVGIDGTKKILNI